MHITVAGTQIFLRMSYIATGWPAYSGASVLLHLSACDLATSEHMLICSQTCMMMGNCCRSWPECLLTWHWYNSSAGDGSLVSMDVAQSASKASCGSAALYLAHWSACLVDLMHASANLLDCG